MIAQVKCLLKVLTPQVLPVRRASLLTGTRVRPMWGLREVESTDCYLRDHKPV